MKKIIVFVIVALAYFFALYSCVESPFTDIKKWKAVYNNIENFTYEGKTIANDYLFSNGNGVSIIVYDKSLECVVSFNKDIVLYRTNGYMSRKVGRKLYKKVPQDKCEDTTQDFITALSNGK